MSKKILVLIFITLLIYVAYGISSYGSFFRIIPYITVFDETVYQPNPFPPIGACFNDCRGYSKVLSCDDKEAWFINLFGKECRFFCMGEFHTSCPR